MTLSIYYSYRYLWNKGEKEGLKSGVDPKVAAGCGGGGGGGNYN